MANTVKKQQKSDALRKSILKLACTPGGLVKQTGEWKEVKLGQVIEFSLGKTPPRKELIYWSNATYPWVSISDLIDGKTITTTKEKVNQYSADNLFRKPPSPTGTLLMSFKLTIGKVSILGVDAFHNEAIISIFPKSEVFREWLFYMLPTISTDGDTKNAVKGKTLNSSSLRNLLLPLPPLAEQHTIVDRLEKILPLVDRYAELEREREMISMAT